MRKVINFLKKLNNSINYVNKLNNELSINNDYYISRMLVENRILLKKMTNQKLNIVLIAFEPATWLMFQSIYDTFSKSDQVNITVLVIPYAHSTLPTGTYKDDGLREYLDTLGIPYIYGYNEKTNTWIDLFQLHPDYVFYQAPYNGMYPDVLKSDYVCQFAQICYLPYGVSITKGEIEETIHPMDFFDNAFFCFVETEMHKQNLIVSLQDRGGVIANQNVIAVGSTKIEQLYKNYQHSERGKYFTILWTPRWNTKEGVCTFFDYYDSLIKYTEQNENIRLIFRPHPLAFQNFIATGELTLNEVDNIKNKFSGEKFVLDMSSNYLPSFNEADILIADITSLMYEFFPMGKPIIYTHKKNIFNNFGEDLSKGFYVVSDKEELFDTLNSIREGKHLLKKTIKQLNDLYFSDMNASEKILEILLS